MNVHIQGSVLHQSTSTTFDFAAGGSKRKSAIELSIQNAFDERGRLSHNILTSPMTSGQYDRVYPIKPQYFGVEISQKF